MSVIDEMLQTNEKFCANLPEEYKAYEHEDHHDSKQDCNEFFHVFSLQKRFFYM